jgi:GNAT superfamily N-acetyltransferase
MTVRKARDRDIGYITRWLREEFDEAGRGFLYNFLSHLEGHGREGVYVVTANGIPVAFQLGECTPDVFCVKQEYRGRGLGTALLHALEDRARERGMNILRGECSPKESLSFWEKHGFVRYDDGSGKIRVYKIIQRVLAPILGRPERAVSIQFYGEEALDTESVVKSYNTVVGGLSADGTISLPHRIIAVYDARWPRKDLVVTVTVDGVLLYHGKAKYAAHAGLCNDDVGRCFFIDAVIPSGSQEPEEAV